jgi:hypothetical protein
MLYMVTFTMNIHQMLAYIPYMDPMGNCSNVFPYFPYMVGTSILGSNVFVFHIPSGYLLHSHGKLPCYQEVNHL